MNQKQALTLALKLAVTAEDEKSSQKALKMAKGIASNMKKADVESCKAHVESDIARHKGVTCVICNMEYFGYGNNAEPVAEGICCDPCNETIVLPNRAMFPFPDPDGDTVYLRED